MKGIILYVITVLVCLLVGLTLACGIVVLFTGVSPKLDGFDFAMVLTMVQS